MPQVVIPNGQSMGSPGLVGSPACFAFVDYGDPNVRSDPMGLLGGCALGGTYQRLEGTSATTCLYVETAQPNGSTNVNGMWTSK